MGLGKLMGNRSVERFSEEDIRGYLLTRLNKVFVDAWWIGGEWLQNAFRLTHTLRMPLLLPLSETDRYQVSHPAQHFFTFLADAKERNMILNFVLRSQEPNMPKFLAQFLTFTLLSVSVLNLIPKLDTVIVNQTVILKSTMFSNCLLSVLLFYETKNLSWTFGLNFALFNEVQNEYLEMLLLLIIHY